MARIVATLPLPIGGGLSAEPVEKLIAQELELKKALDRSWLYNMAMRSIHFCFSNQPICHTFELHRWDFMMS